MTQTVKADASKSLDDLAWELYESARKDQVAEECGTTPDKVTIMRYKEPAGTINPTPFRLMVEKMFRDIADEKGIPVEEYDGTIYAGHTTYRNPFKEERYWQTLRSL